MVLELNKDKLDEMMLDMISDNDYNNRYTKFCLFWDVYEREIKQ